MTRKFVRFLKIFRIFFQKWSQASTIFGMQGLVTFLLILNKNGSPYFAVILKNSKQMNGCHLYSTYNKEIPLWRMFSRPFHISGKNKMIIKPPKQRFSHSIFSKLQESLSQRIFPNSSRECMEWDGKGKYSPRTFPTMDPKRQFGYS